MLLGGLGVGQGTAVQGGGDRVGDAHGSIYLGDLLHRQDIGQVILALAAVLLGIGQADQAHLPHLGIQVVGEFGGGIPHQDVLGQFLFGKRLDRGLDGQLVFVQGKVHIGILPFCFSVGPGLVFWQYIKQPACQF